MSGHSKWSQIKRTKGALDVKRGVLFSKLSKKISIAVREGGNIGDPAMNFKLKGAIEKAREAGMPNDNVERAIKKGLGQDGAVAIQEVIYEGYGPFGTAFLIEAATDNTNRTVGNIKHIFSKHGGSLGSQGSVAWLFKTRGQILVERDRDDLAELALVAIDAGAEDVQESDEGLTVLTDPATLQFVNQNLVHANATVIESEIIKQTTQAVELTEEQKPTIEKLLNELENDEDVIAVHTSANI
jgi:YebC/PmpR family DNA-binding regulatory protein